MLCVCGGVVRVGVMLVINLSLGLHTFTEKTGAACGRGCRVVWSLAALKGEVEKTLE